jgi:uncharacterized protein involved in exopolysaccharide biosynthesis
MLYVPEEFRANADLAMNMPSDEDNLNFNPAAYMPLLESDEVLHRVRDEYAAKFHRKPTYEKFVKQFKTKSEVLQDTTVRKDVSPVIHLTVQTPGRDEARFLMESWIRNFIRQFGNVRADGFRRSLEMLRKEDARLDEEMRKTEAERAADSAQLALQEKLLAEKMDFIAPAQPPARPPDSPLSLQYNASNLQVSVQQPAPAKPPGLIARKLEVDIALARARQGIAAHGTSTPAELEIESKTLESFIADVQRSVGELQKTVAELQEKINTATRRIQVLAAMQSELHRRLDRINSVASLYREPVLEGAPEGGDFRVLSNPVTPELRVWPKRTLAAGVAAIAAFVICLCAALLYNYVEEARRRAVARPEA